MKMMPPKRKNENSKNVSVILSNTFADVLCLMLIPGENDFDFNTYNPHKIIFLTLYLLTNTTKYIIPATIPNSENRTAENTISLRVKYLIRTVWKKSLALSCCS